MVENTDKQDLTNNLEKIAEIRAEIGDNLDNIADNLAAADLEGLEYAIADIRQKSQNLKAGVFRIFVLGDVKRGKSTVINALIGEYFLVGLTETKTSFRYFYRTQVYQSPPAPPPSLEPPPKSAPELIPPLYPELSW